MQKPQLDTEQKREEERIHALLALSTAHPTETGPCPDAEMLAALADNRVDDRETKEKLLSHTASCPDCYEIWLSISSQEHIEEEVNGADEWYSTEEVYASVGKGVVDLQKEPLQKSSTFSSPKPWFSKVLHSMQQQKAPAVAFVAMASIALFWGSRHLLSPGSSPPLEEMETAPVPARQLPLAKGKQVPLPPGSPEPQQESLLENSDAASGSLSFERKELDFALKRGEASAPQPSPVLKAATPEAYTLTFEVWLKKLGEECHPGKEAILLSEQQLSEFNALHSHHGTPQTSHLQSLLSRGDNTVQCTELLSLIRFLTQRQQE